LRTSKVIGFPSNLIVESTNICNLECPLCPTGQKIKGREKGQMSFSNFKKIIDEIGRFLYSVRLENWGEPLLNKDLFEIIKYAKSKKITVIFNSNLTVLDEEKAKKLVLSGLDSIKISLDGATQDTYSKYRKGGDFNTVVNNIRLLLKTRSEAKKKTPFIEVQFIVTKHNEHQIDQVKQLCADLGADSLVLGQLRPDLRMEYFNPDDQGFEILKDWLPKDESYSYFNYSTKTRKNVPKTCNWLWTSSVVSWDGSMIPCCGFYEETYDFGNFFKEGFKKIWNGKKYRAARELIGKRKVSDQKLGCMRCFKHGIIG